MAQPKVLAIISARGGSKGLPRKNVLLARGKPLIAWTIEAARDSNCVTRLILSSDDDEIIETARRFGCEVPFKRPAELATDAANSNDVVLHALGELPGYDYVVLLQPTSPLRSAHDIDAAFELMQKSGTSSCVSVTPVEESPYWMYRVAENHRLSPVLETKAASRRQDLPPVFMLNGAIYIATTEYLTLSGGFLGESTVGYVMPRARSLDIDTERDLSQFNSNIGK